MKFYESPLKYGETFPTFVSYLLGIIISLVSLGRRGSLSRESCIFDVERLYDGNVRRDSKYACTSTDNVRIRKSDRLSLRNIVATANTRNYILVKTRISNANENVHPLSRYSRKGKMAMTFSQETKRCIENNVPRFDLLEIVQRHEVDGYWQISNAAVSRARLASVRIAKSPPTGYGVLPNPLDRVLTWYEVRTTSYLETG